MNRSNQRKLEGKPGQGKVRVRVRVRVMVKVRVRVMECAVGLAQLEVGGLRLEA